MRASRPGLWARNAPRCCAIFLPESGQGPEMLHIRISLRRQFLELFDDAGGLLRQYAVSTSKNGAGEQRDSDCTPRGKHIIRAKIGADDVLAARRAVAVALLSGAVLRGRDGVLPEQAARVVEQFEELSPQADSNVQHLRPLPAFRQKNRA